jgi:hypothetical protein
MLEGGRLGERAVQQTEIELGRVPGGSYGDLGGLGHGRRGGEGRDGASLDLMVARGLARTRSPRPHQRRPHDPDRRRDRRAYRGHPTPPRCVFRSDLGSHSGGTWAGIPGKIRHHR